MNRRIAKKVWRRFMQNESQYPRTTLLASALRMRHTTHMTWMKSLSLAQLRWILFGPNRLVPR